MTIAYAQVLSYCSQLSQDFDNTNHELVFDNFQKIWNSIENASLLLNEKTFQSSVISLNVNTYNNTLIHNFIMNKAREFFKTKYSEYREQINSSIFRGAISLNHVDNIRKYLPSSIDSEECLKMSIKYGSWDAFNYFLEEYIPEKQHSKIVQWSHREFWSYHHSGYSSSDFFKKLVHHDLFKNKPLKQDIYNMLEAGEFSFIYEIMQDKKCGELLCELNIHHYYKLLIKNLALKKGETTYNEGFNLLLASVQCIKFDFSQFKISSQLKKNNPDIVQLIEKFILKDKLDLLPEKNKTKSYKI